MHIGAAQIFSSHHFPGRRFHQWRAGEEDGRLVAHHDGFVGHRRYISATCGTGAHHHGNLRNAHGAHVGLVEENSAEVFAVREHFILARQVGTAGIHQVDAWQAILLGDSLSTEVLFNGERVVAAAFYRGVVCNDHAFDALDSTDTGNHAGGSDVLAIHLVGGQWRDLEKGRARVEEGVDAVTHQQLAASDMALLGLLITAFADLAEQRAEAFHLLEHGVAVGGEFGRAGVDLGVQDGHVRLRFNPRGGCARSRRVGRASFRFSPPP